MLTMLPSMPPSTIARAASDDRTNVAVRFTSTVRRNAAGSSSIAGAGRVGDAGVVDDDGQRAELDGPSDDGPEVVVGRHVAAHRVHAVDLGGERLEAIDAAGRGDHRHAAARQQSRDVLADAARRSGDDGDAVEREQVVVAQETISLTWITGWIVV